MARKKKASYAAPEGATTVSNSESAANVAPRKVRKPIKFGEGAQSLFFTMPLLGVALGFLLLASDPILVLLAALSTGGCGMMAAYAFVDGQAREKPKVDPTIVYLIVAIVSFVGCFVLGLGILFGGFSPMIVKALGCLLALLGASTGYCHWTYASADFTQSEKAKPIETPSSDVQETVVFEEATQ